MKLIKTQISDDYVLDFLNSKFGQNISNFTRIKGGEFSQAFGFEINNQGKVIRFNTLYDIGFIKDQYCHEHFSSFGIPIPEIEEIGKIQDFHYAISTRVPGETLLSLSPAQHLELVPEIFTTLEKLWAIPPMKTGYGYWNDKTQAAEFPDRLSWLHSYNMPENWAKIHSQQPQFDPNLIHKIYDKILNLSQYIPEQAYVIHGDFGFTNTLAQNGKITGVIDWTESMYGDFVYDLCWMQFNSKEIDYLSLYRNRPTQFNLENHDKRSELYLLIIGMDSASILAESNRIKESQECIDILYKFKLLK